MEQYHVTGMSCAACSARVEKAVSAVPGVTACSVNLLTNSMGVEGTASEEEVVRAVVAAGYGASPKTSMHPVGQQTSALEDTETPKLKRRLLASLLLLIPLMYESMGHMLWNWPLPPFMDGNHIAMGLYELLLSAMIMVINQRFFISGFRGLLHRTPNMDTLVAMGSASAFIYSMVSLFGMSGAVMSGDTELVMTYMNGFYFESAATILTLITVGKTLEARAKGKTTDAIRGLMELSPKTAVLLRDGQEVRVGIEQVRPGDHFVVRPGDSIPADGIVSEGSGAVNESALTGESIPVDKQPGDSVSAATINQSGFLICEATRVGEDTALSQIIRMVSDASATKAPIAKIADRVSGVFVPAVLLIGLVTLIVWLAAGQSVGFALARAISVLVISCPCALGLATPVAIMVGSGKGAGSGILFKTAVSLEEAGRIQIAALDKTGTITRGEPKVRSMMPADGISEEQLLSYACMLEQRSEHPLARAILEEAESREISVPAADDFQSKAGSGLRGTVMGQPVVGGNLKYVSRFAQIPEQFRSFADDCSSKGMTSMFFALNGALLGVIAVADVIREDSAEAIRQLKAMGIHVVMLTGDNEATARTIGTEAGVDEVIAGVLPDGKEAVIRALQEKGKVAMVGDGINDAPALTRADVGIAIGAGTDIAIDAADIVLMKSTLLDVAAAIRLSRATLKNIHENLFWAFFYNAVGIPLAAGLWIPIFGWTLSPMFGAAAMGLSSFCVVSNALRLNLFKPYDTGKARPSGNTLGHEVLSVQIIKPEEDETMEIRVKGMMCTHCEAHVKKALEKLEGVLEATADAKAGTVVLRTEKPVDPALIKAAVEEAGYEFIG